MFCSIFLKYILKISVNIIKMHNFSFFRLCCLIYFPKQIIWHTGLSSLAIDPSFCFKVCLCAGFLDKLYRKTTLDINHSEYFSKIWFYKKSQPWTNTVTDFLKRANFRSFCKHDFVYRQTSKILCTLTNRSCIKPANQMFSLPFFSEKYITCFVIVFVTYD